VHALAERINDASAKVLITADGTFQRGQVIDLKTVSDAAEQLSEHRDNDRRETCGQSGDDV
jgi:acyl-coenzyme A synthetase/AMP-(fatty) acid ligase